MDNLEIAKALFGNKPQQPNGGQTTTTYGIAVGDSENGIVRVNLGGDTVSVDDDQTVEIETTFAVFEGDEVIISLVGADGTGKAPCVIGVVGRGDQQQTEIDSVTNYVWNDEHGLHVSTEERSVQGANILLDSDSLDIRNGASDSEADQTVYASFGREVTIGSRASGSTVGLYSQVFGQKCTAAGDYSFASGYQTMARGTYSHAEGYSNSIYTGDNSHVEGANNEIRASYAHAEGVGNEVNGNASHAEGRLNTVGPYSHVEGEGNTVSGWYCHAEGTHNLASSNNQHVQGKYNVDDSNSTYADIAGNGSADNARSNAYNMDWNGNAEFQGEVYVGGCTPNGETPYPVVRYNTSNSKQEYYDKANSAWAQVPGGGGGGGWTSLWTNSDPSSNFSAQTVPLDLSDYTWIAIIATISTSSTAETTHLVRVGGSVILSVPNLGSTQYFYKREASVTTSGITFGTGYRNNTSTSGTNYCIPVAIYGVSVEYNLDWKTFSGAIINFTTIKAHAIQSAIVDFSPSQDFNGYDKPWAGGAGKNLIDDSKRYVSAATTVYVGAESNAYTVALPAGTYTISVDFSGEPYGMFYREANDSANTSLWNSGYGTTEKTFTLENDGTYRFWVYRNTNAGGVDPTKIIHVQIELGSTATAWSPYSNICPITGWSDIDVYREAQYDAGATPYVSVSLGGTQYKGSLNVVSGELTLTDGYIASYNGEVLPSTWLSDRDEYAVGTTPTTGAQVVYELASPTTTYLTPQAITALQGPNTMWSNVGNITVVARGE